jgi:hypothetical protein
LRFDDLQKYGLTALSQNLYQLSTFGKQICSFVVLLRLGGCIIIRYPVECKGGADVCNQDSNALDREGKVTHDQSASQESTGLVVSPLM